MVKQLYEMKFRHKGKLIKKLVWSSDSADFINSLYAGKRDYVGITQLTHYKPRKRSRGLFDF